MTCFSCRWSKWNLRGLSCGRFPRFAVRLCDCFEYEPGTDEMENRDDDFYAKSPEEHSLYERSISSRSKN
jgi:hypothetical protein